MSPEITTSWILAVVPELSLLILLLLMLLYDRLLKPENQRNVGLFTAWGAFVVLVITFGLWLLFDEPNVSAELGESLIWGGMLRHDLVTLVFRVMFLVALMMTSLLSLDVPRLQNGGYFALLITATIGFSLMAASADLIMLYVALETASISSYILAGYFTDSKRSSEAGMKYFVYGAFATAVMLYGMSFLYGVTTHIGITQFGQTPGTNLYVIGSMLAFLEGSLPLETTAVLLIAIVSIVAGFAFKISAVPFHFWTPDVYEGSPTPFTGFVSTASKAAGFAIFLRVFTSGAMGMPDQSSMWWAMLVAMTIITMTLGNMAAIWQKNMKRMLAYSSIAQAGYAMIGLVTLSQDGSGATMFYLLMYVFTNIAAFGGIMLVSNVTGSERMEDFNGLSRRSPYLALIMLFALLSLSGIPPTAGFFGKFFIFRAAVEQGLWWLAAIGILNAFVALYYYLSVVKYMYLYRSDEEDIPIPISRAAWTGLLVSLFFILYLGVFAGAAFEWTKEAAGAFYALIG